MIKQSISLTFLAICIVNSSSAFTPIYPGTILQGINLNSTSVAKKGQDEFIDFSGTWKGTCIINNYETEETVIIKNTDQYIEFGNKHFLIGYGLHSESSANPQVTYFDHKQFDWSKDGKSLNMQGTKVVAVSPNSPLTTYLFTNIISLVNDQILISIKFKGFQNMELIAEDSGNCVLSRV